MLKITIRRYSSSRKTLSHRSRNKSWNRQGFKQLGIVVLTEDSIEVSHEKPKVNILNQWTYQARLYNAAYYVAKNKDMELIQLVSFGCGTDAITSDEVKDILERNNKIYTQLKIDETIIQAQLK